MGVHRILIGEGAELYLPFAESRLRELETMVGDGTVSQTFNVGDASIQVRIVGDEHYITITMGGEGFFFEFATSGKPITRIATGVVDSIFGALTMYATAWVKTEVKVDDGRIVIEPRMTQKASSFSGANYNYSLNKRPLQISHINESVTYPQIDPAKRAMGIYDRIVGSSFAPGHSFTGGPFWQAPLSAPGPMRVNFQTGFPFSVTTRDLSYDLPLAVADGITDFEEYAVSTNADWPRESGVQKVTHEKHGTREFGITIDASGTFHIFPLGAPRLPYTSYDADTVDPKYVHHIAPSYPSWMFVAPRTMKDFAANTGGKTLHDFFVDFPDYEWKFNHLGTKACAVVFKKEQFVNDAAYWAVDATSQAWTQAKWDGFLYKYLGPYQETFLDRSMGARTGEDIFMYGPGLIEVEIKITLTGPNTKDFTSEVVVTEIRNPNTAIECPVVAGYSYIDIDSKNISAGDLLVLDVEYFYAKDSTYSYEEYVVNPDRYFWKLRNLTTGATVFYKDGFALVAYDMCCVAFAFKVQPFTYRLVTSPKKRTETNSGGPYTTEWCAEQTALWLVHSAETVTVLYPDTMNAANKQAVLDAITFDPADYVQQVSAQLPDMRIVPLSFEQDGWTTAKMQQLRDYVAYGAQYINDAMWHIEDPNIFDYGYSFFNGVKMYYKSSSNIYQRPAWTEVPQYVIALDGNVLQNFYATNPRWGWIAYMGAIRRLLAITPFTTFFAHPNGSIGIFNNAFIYNPEGAPSTRYGSSIRTAIFLCDILEGYDVTKMEHCVFDYIRLKATTSTGGAAEPLETSFIALYNEARERSIKEETIDAGAFEPIDRFELKATFKYKFKEWWPTGGVNGTESGYAIEVMQYGCNFMGQDWFRIEPMITGSTDVDRPYISFAPNEMGSLVGVSFMNTWSSQRIEVFYQPTGEPGAFDGGYKVWSDKPLFHNSVSPAARWPITFTNPQIIMG